MRQVQQKRAGKGGAGEGLGGELELSFGEIGERLHVEGAGTIEPFLVLLGGEGAEEAQAACIVWDSSGARKPAAGSPTGSAGGRWQHAHDQGAAFAFLVEAFEQVGAFEVFGLPVFEPRGEVLAGFGGVAAVVEPAQFGSTLRSAVAHLFLRGAHPAGRRSDNRRRICAGVGPARCAGSGRSSAASGRKWPLETPRIIDLAPTILSLLGVPAMRELEGRVILDCNVSSRANRGSQFRERSAKTSALQSPSIKTSRHSIEILETRIAPAVFFVNGTSLTLTDSAGNVVAGDAAAATLAGANAAILLSAGDSIAYDLNGNHKIDAAVDRPST